MRLTSSGAALSFASIWTRLQLTPALCLTTYLLCAHLTLRKKENKRLSQNVKLML